MTALVRDIPSMGSRSLYVRAKVLGQERIVFVEYLLYSMHAEIKRLSIERAGYMLMPPADELAEADERELSLVREAMQELEIVIGHEIVQAGKRAGHAI